MQEYINLAKKRKSGWVTYMWPKKEGGKSFEKHTYVELAETEDGNKYVVGCGIYLDDK